MKSWPSYILFLSIALPLLFGSCLKEDDYPPFIYETVGMSLSNADNSGEAPVSDNDSVPLPAYAIQMNLSMTMKDESQADPNESSFKNEDEVLDFSITSPTVFNGVPANQSLNHFFNCSGGTGTGSEITSPYTNLFSGGVRGQDEWTVSRYFMLMQPPAATGNYTFIVSGTFNDGRVLSDTVTVKLY